MDSFYSFNKTVWLLLLTVLSQSRGLYAQADDTENNCPSLSAQEVVDFDAGTAKDIREIHIRHNLKGDVMLRDNPNDILKVVLNKWGDSQADLDNIWLMNTLFDAGLGTVLLLQVNSKDKATSVLAIVGGVLGTVVFLGIICISIWLYHRRSNQPRAAAYTSAGDSVDGTLTHSERGSSLRSHQSSQSTLLTSGPGSQTSGERERIQYGYPPPPPRANQALPKETTTPKKQLSEVPGSQSRGGVGSPRGMYKSTLLSFTLVAVVTLSYAVCQRDRDMQIVINIPKDLKINSVKLFVNKEYQNYIDAAAWQGEKNSSLQLYDLPNVKITTAPPCSVQQVCPGAHIQGLVGCDPADGSCVCQRGYQLHSGVCIDYDECSTVADICPDGALCKNTMGSYMCNCGPGFYHHHRTCRPCTRECGEGKYASSPCTMSSDTVCTACSKCTGATFEAKPCSTAQDTYCIHAAHPLLISEGETTVTFLEGLKVESSSHVFMENLRNTKTYETNYYVLDTKQSIDFIWYRNSGVRINIGVSDVEMIPTYEDVTYDSDSAYMMGEQNDINEKQQFEKIMNKHCRHPIPDYYTLTLERKRDRTTKAWPITCDSTNSTVPKCPQNYMDGDTYLFRTLEEPCVKHDSYPEKLKRASNSLICTDETHLLEGLFNMSAMSVHPMTFAPKRCLTSRMHCEQCLEDQCNRRDPWQARCCKIDCYDSPACKHGASSHCSGQEIQCAMGDAFVYTLQPVYREQHFQCHLRHQKPKILYKLWMYVSIPEYYGFETPRFFYAIKESDVENPDHGWHNTEFLTVEHNSGLRTLDDVMLLGRERQLDTYNYTIHSFKTPSEYGERTPDKNNREGEAAYKVVSTQFDRPFGYSTMTWATDSSGCVKDLTKFKNLQNHYHNDPQPVSIVTQAVRSPYLYWLHSINNPPYMRFSIPANISVLDWYFRDKGRVLVTNSSLQASLGLTADSKIWTISVSGMMSDCPAHMVVTISDRTQEEELFLYDVLVTCPSRFNMSFKVPNWGLKPDKTFEILFKDSEKTHRIFLTHFLFDKDLEPMHRQSLKMESSRLSFGPVPILICSVIILCVCCLMTFVLLSIARKNPPQPVVASRDPSRPRGCCAELKSRTTGQSLFIFFYIVWRILYTFLFTFTILFSVLFICMQPHLRNLSQFDEIQEHHLNFSASYGTNMEVYAEEEVQRHLQVIHHMQEACTYYMQELMSVVSEHMKNITTESQPRRSITQILDRRLQISMRRYWEQVQTFSEKYQQKVEGSMLPALRRYNKRLDAIYHSDWLLMPGSLFNQTDAGKEKTSGFHHRRGAALMPGIHAELDKNKKLSPELVKFARFLELHTVEKVDMLTKTFWQRYWRTLPEVAKLPIKRLNSSTCDNKDSLQQSMLPLDSDAKERSHRDSMRYSAEHLEDDIDRFEDSFQQNDSLTIAVEDILGGADFRVVRFTLLFLDIILVVYRLTHTALAVKALCVGFEQKVELTAQECSKTCQSLGLQACSGKSACELLLPHKQSDPQVQLEYQIKTSTPHKANGSTSWATTTQPVIKHAQSSPSYCRSLIWNPLHSTIIPWIVILLVMCIGAYILLALGNAFFSQTVVMQASTYLPSVSSLFYQYYSINEFIASAAASYGQSLTTWCKNFTDQDLVQLHNLVQFFNEEQSLQESRAQAEACSLNYSSSTTRNCGAPSGQNELQLPMLPCNFVPVQPILYSGYQHSLYEKELWDDLSPLVSACRNILRIFSYGMLSILACAALVYSLGVTVFHGLQSQGVFPTCVVYIVPAGYMELEVAGVGQGDDSLEGEATCTSTTESSGNVATVSPRTSTKFPLHVRFATKTKTNNGSKKGKPKMMLKDFHYSETKV